MVCLSLAFLNFSIYCFSFANIKWSLPLKLSNSSSLIIGLFIVSISRFQSTSGVVRRTIHDGTTSIAFGSTFQSTSGVVRRTIPLSCSATSRVSTFQSTSGVVRRTITDRPGTSADPAVSIHARRCAPGDPVCLQ